MFDKVEFNEDVAPAVLGDVNELTLQTYRDRLQSASSGQWKIQLDMAAA